MTEDLAARLLAAIDETERIARAAADGDSGDWFVGDKWNVYRREDTTPLDDEATNALVVYDNVHDQSVHIVHNDPQAVLRRCAADRKILELHNDPVRGFSTLQCATCVGSWATEEGEDWPCGTLRALAAAYGITEETT